MAKANSANYGIDPLHQRRLTAIRSISHPEIGIVAALNYCVDHEIDVPQHLAEDAVNLLCTLLRRERPKKKGRGSGAIARYRLNLMHVARWKAVVDFLQKRDSILKQISELERGDKTAKNELASLKMKLWFVGTLNRIFEGVQVALCGSFAYGGTDAISKSYRKIEADQSLVPYSLDFSILKKLGLEDTLGPSGLNKGLPRHEPCRDGKASSSDRPRWQGRAGPRKKPEMFEQTLIHGKK